MNCIQEAKQLIDNDISRHHTIANIAEKTGIGQTKLKKGFRHVNGTGLYAYLKKARMLKGAELLATTDKTVKEIASLTGFTYTNNFISAFAGYYGITPNKYRQLHNKSTYTIYLP
jgi:AraC-like DNA-binding protein